MFSWHFHFLHHVLYVYRYSSTSVVVYADTGSRVHVRSGFFFFLTHLLIFSNSKLIITTPSRSCLLFLLPDTDENIILCMRHEISKLFFIFLKIKPNQTRNRRNRTEKNWFQNPNPYLNFIRKLKPIYTCR